MSSRLAFIAPAVLLVAACADDGNADSGTSTAAPQDTAEMASEVDAAPKTPATDAMPSGDMADHPPLEAPAAGMTAEVDFVGTDGQPTGTAIVSAGPNGLLLRVDLMGLTPGFHGVHLHQVGDCSDPGEGFKASGSHINPEGNAHGLMNEDGYELADLPNVYAHMTGHARAELFAAGLSYDAALDADGFAMVVHANPDDHQTQPIGGAGSRVACAAFTR